MLVIINRAVPGSGKTSITNKIASYFEKNGVKVAIHSTDEFFLQAAGKYAFDINKLFYNHQLNLEFFIRSLESKIPIVICDNTNIIPWETEPYTKSARQHGYHILCLNFEPRDLELHVKSQQITVEKPDAHQVPKDILERMISAFYCYNSLLEIKNSPDPLLHLDYEWNMVTNKKIIKKGSVSRHFDVDYVLTIEPNQYKLMLNQIGLEIETYLKLSQSRN